MVAPAKFRSIRAFRDFERRSALGASPLRVMAALKGTGEGMRKMR